MPQVSVTQQLVSSSFDWKTISKARLSQKQGDVLNWSFDIGGSRILGSVQGPRKDPYRVTVHILEDSEDEQKYLAGSCTCPIERDCVHAAAVALAAVEDLESAGYGEMVKGAPDPPAAQPGGDAASSPVVSAWLRKLVAAVETRSQAEEQAVYVLNIDRLSVHPQLKVEALVARALKAGGYGQGSSLTWRQLASTQARFACDEDRAIAQLLASTTSMRTLHTGTDLPDDPPVIDLLLERMVATGRCFWTDKLTAQPLIAGPAKEGRIDWILQRDGRQRTEIIIDEEDVQVLYSASPWYVDRAKGECGPVKLPFSFKLAAALCAAPPLAASDIEPVLRAIEQAAPSLSLPLPEFGVEEEERSGPPVARLTLKLQEFEHKKLLESGEARKANIAVLSFDYGFDTSKLADSWREFRFLERNRSVLRKRDLSFEKAASELISGCNFTRISGRFRQYNEECFTAKSKEDWLSFMQFTLPRLQEEGWRVFVDRSFQHQVVELDDCLLAQVGEGGGGFWFSFDLGIDLDGQRLSLLPVLTSALEQAAIDRSVEGIEHLNVRGKFYANLPDGRLISLPFDRVRSILVTLVELFDRDSLSADGRLAISIPQAIALLGKETEEGLRWSGSERLRNLAVQIGNFGNIEPLPEPGGFLAKLRPYQSEGLGWLQFLSKCKIGGILADDMGLGKTVQALAHILTEKREGRLDRAALVVCPTSVVPNWIAEARRLAPDLRLLSWHGASRSERFSQISGADLVFTTYPLLSRDADELAAVDWYAVILDEAQAIKNPKSKAAQVAFRLQAGHRLCMTGTPIENHLGELWSQLNFLMPGMLGSQATFNRLFRVPIEKANDKARQELLSSRIRPFLLRRRKDQVAGDLPKKSVMIQRIELDGAQRDLYETVRLSVHERVLQEIKAKGLAGSQIVILDALMKLRQICCDPRLVKLTAASHVAESAKLACLLDMLEELVEEGRRVLIFSQFTSMLDLIVPELDKLRIPFVQLRGDTDDRATPVSRFQRGDVPLFLISLKAGGTGLNLTAADTVIHYDPWWNPAVEDQATDRAHRIGQDKPVFVYKLITSGTIEQRMLEYQERKKAIADTMLGASSGASPSFNQADLESLFAPLDES